MTKCEGVEGPDGMICRIHNVVLQERTIQEDGHNAPDMQAWYCPISGETAIFSAALAPKMHSDFPA
jgi:hypothetical protein